MKIIEIRRHTFRDKEGHITEEGRRLIEFAKKTLLKKYSAFYSSPKIRAIETLEAFGFSNPILEDRFSTISIPREIDEHAIKIAKEENKSLLQSYFTIPECIKILENTGKKVIRAIKEIGDEINDDEAAFCISHGGTIEPAILIALGKDFSLEVIGEELKECEGARFCIEEDKIISVEIIRLITSNM
jgi:broad specificity phosphatase PhoE